jgi:hypothetical protein
LSLRSLRNPGHREKVFYTLGHFLEVQMLGGGGSGAGRPRSRSGSRSPDRTSSTATLGDYRPGSSNSTSSRDAAAAGGKPKKKKKNIKRNATSPDRARGPAQVSLMLKFREVLNL